MVGTRKLDGNLSPPATTVPNQADCLPIWWPTLSTPRRRSRGHCTDKTLPIAGCTAKNSRAQPPDRRQGHRRIPMAISRISASRCRRSSPRNAAVVDAMADSARIFTGRNSRLMAIPSCRLRIDRLPDGAWRRAGPCSRHQWRQGLARKDRTAARQFAVRKGMPRIRRQGFFGTCGRCCSRSRSTS